MKNKKVVINKCYGGFSLSPKAVKMYAELKGWHVGDNKDWKEMSQEERILQNQKYDKINIGNRHIDRDDPCLVQAVEELREEANGDCADLRVIEIPADVDFEIDEYDGMECVREVHRVWS